MKAKNKHRIKLAQTVQHWVTRIGVLGLNPYTSLLIFRDVVQLKKNG